MLNKVLSLALVFCVAAPPIVMAEESLIPPKGKITGLRYKQPAPYSGILLNSVAAAKLLTDKDFNEEQWKLKLQYELAKMAAALNLTIETQKISYQSLHEKHKTLIAIKDGEIERLSTIASSQSDHSKWWATGGLVVGIILTVAVVYAVNPEGR